VARFGGKSTIVLMNIHEEEFTNVNPEVELHIKLKVLQIVSLIQDDMNLGSGYSSCCSSYLVVGCSTYLVVDCSSYLVVDCSSYLAISIVEMGQNIGTIADFMSSDSVTFP